MLKNKEKKTQDESAWGAMSLVFELGYIIAIPAVGFSFGGRYMDIHFGTSPLFLLLGICSALMLSAYMVYTKVKKI